MNSNKRNTLFTNSETLENGAVYFIRSSANNNYLWDMPNGNTDNGTQPILCDYNGFGNQRFILREEAEYENKMYYTIIPLYAPSKTLKIENSNDNVFLTLSSNNNNSYSNFLSNKFIIEKTNTGYKISTGSSTFTKYLCVQDNLVQTYNKIEQIECSNPDSNLFCNWEFCKTDSLGLDLLNKVYIDRTSISYFNITPPTLGEYIIETGKCGLRNIDTYLQIYDGNNLIAFNDDIDGANNRYSKISINFNNYSDLSVRVRGYTTNDIGNIYLVFRPKYPLYFSAMYDYDKNNNDRPSTLESIKESLPNHYIEVQANRGKNAILDFAPNGKQKINSEYYVFSGHGFSNASGVEFYNGSNSEGAITEGLMWDEIPSMNGTKIALWMSCHSARNYFKNENINTQMTSMAYQTTYMGAEYSLGYVGTIYDTTQRDFPKNFFDAVQNNSIKDAIDIATEKTINDNWWWWNFFGKFNDDFNNPIIYKKGDSLKDSCGNGNYENDKKGVSNPTIDLNNYTYINNTNKSIDNIDNEISKFEKQFSHRFLTTIKNQIIKLAFKCNYSNGDVIYFNLSEKKEISSNEFELLMGTPSDEIIKLVSNHYI